MFERQIKGIIAVSVILALIPLVLFLTSSLMNSKYPVLSESNLQTIIIEVVSENGESGVFFAEPGTSMNQIFSQAGFNRIITEDNQIRNGMKIRLISEEDQRGVIIEKMDAAKRLALGLPLDINRASFDDLTLIPGVGGILAADIVAWREKIGRFETLDQMMEIKGIKGKKMSKLRQYLYVDRL